MQRGPTNHSHSKNKQALPHCLNAAQNPPSTSHSILQYHIYLLPEIHTDSPSLPQLLLFQRHTKQGWSCFCERVEGRGGTQQGTNKKTKHTLGPSRPSICPLSTDHFTNPNSASCAALSRRTRSQVWIACRITNCQNKNEGRATFSSPTTKNRGKKRIFGFSS